METIAVYWEPKIRVYGLTKQFGLTLFNLTFAVGDLAFWGDQIKALEQNGNQFALVTLQAVSGATMRLGLVPAADTSSSDISGRLEKIVENRGATFLQVVAPVALLYLHGPHFQDRYGIADAVFSPLGKANIPILAAACAGTSVYIVVPGGCAAEVEACLAETFVL